MSVFETLNAVNCNGHTEKKNGLTYLSWAWAWAEVKKRYPDALYTVYEDANGRPYHTDGRTCWVKTGVTINTLEHIEYLPVMDFRNASIPLDKVTSMEVNKAVQRSLTKAIARHGLGLYIYAGEDLPEVDETAKEAPAQPTKAKTKREVHPLAKSAWEAFRRYAAEHKMTDASRNSAWKLMVKEAGGSDESSVTEDGWKNIIARINNEGVN